MKQLIAEMRKSLRLTSKNIKESLDAHLDDIKKIALKNGARLEDMEELQGVIDDLKFDIAGELEKLCDPE